MNKTKDYTLKAVKNYTARKRESHSSVQFYVDKQDLSQFKSKINPESLSSHLKKYIKNLINRA
ncbi:hypothetical protein UFOVP733_11 [uncultured Caudovirales phage]|uniref:Uncharacterized protein n=1 Tax=uncultured Caudovirales phage TaxID=2100421 RepID=A0A6J7X2L2_9CAUD|nr:hypothetical protein UFOVP733_11 [uncultured Caudovirales phage]CAB5224954.1 hypothetical protein UFOVP743_48 [uncultured Caudovirales phage]